MAEKINSYKGFKKDMTCRNFKYEEGETYKEENANVCNAGFHACEYPLDCFSHYPPATSVYHEVIQSGSLSKSNVDTEVSSTKIKIGAEIGIAGIVKAAIKYTKSRTTTECTNENAATAGYCGAAIAGKFGEATAGDSGAAIAGYCGAATAGDSGAAIAGYCGEATAGDSGAATAGDYGEATAGDSGAATSRGSVSVGENGIGAVRGNHVKAKGGIGSIIIVAEENKNSCEVEEWKVMVVDGEKIKADTWYQLTGGEFVESED